MGRPPIGKTAMTDAERQRRHRAQFRDSKPVTKPAKPDATRWQGEIAALKDENAKLKAELARERLRVAAEAKHSKPDVDDGDQAAAAGPLGKKVFKILLKLDDANDNTVLVAARTLVSNLKANGSDLRILADALGAELEKQEKAKPAPQPDIDFAAVKAVVTRYAADRTTVKYNAVWRAVVAAMPILDEPGVTHGSGISRYIQGCLRRLGFKGSSSGLSWSR